MVQQQEQVEQILQKLAEGLAEPVIGQQFFDSVVRYLAETLKVDVVLIGSLTPDQMGVQTVALLKDGELLPTVEYGLVATPCQSVVDSDFCAYQEDVADLFPEDELLVDWEIEGYAAIPLFNSQGEPLGLMAILSRKPLRDTSAAESLMRIVAKRVELELERQVYEEKLERSKQELEEKVQERTRKLEEKNRTLEVLNQVAKKLTGESDLNNIVQAVTDAECSITGAEFGAFFYNTVNAAGETYMLYTLSGAPKEAFENFPMPRKSKIFGPTFNGEGIVRSDNIRKDPRYGKNKPYYGMPEGHLPVVSYMAVSVVSQSGQVIGGLFFGHKDEGVFTAQHDEVITNLASQAAVAIDNARLFQETANARKSLEEAKVQLEQKVEDRTAELQQAIEELQRSNEELNRFAYITSHDLKAPLRAISALSSWLEEDYSDKLDEQGKTQLQLMKARVKRMHDLIEGILAYSRAARAAEEDEELVNLQEVVAEVLKLIVVPQSITVEVGPLPTIPFEVNKAYQVFQNLISNAIKFNGEKEGYIEVGAKEQEQEYLLWVKDNGPGIDERYHQKVFQLFQRLDKGGDTDSTGIGLPIVKKIIEYAGGRIWVESEKGTGATFFFTIPRE